MKRIILTGGGTAGHVTPNIALLPGLKERGYDIHYIGSYNGIEKELIEQFGIPYHGISSGKLRRYFSLQNFTDPFRVLKGFGEAKKIIKDLKPDVIFSKGGFVRFNDSDELKSNLNQLFNQDLNFFSGMENPRNLGKLIEIANKEESYENKGLKFLNLLQRS